MKRKLAMGLRWSMAVSTCLCLASCVLDPIPRCSDLEVGDRLLVTIREPLETPACEPALGFVEGAELRLLVEGYGLASACSSAIGPTEMAGLALQYWIEASESASGSAAFASTSRATFGSCKGDLLITLLTESSEPNSFDTVRVNYVDAQVDSTCPGNCSVHYAVDVERL